MKTEDTALCGTAGDFVSNGIIYTKKKGEGRLASHLSEFSRAPVAATSLGHCISRGTAKPSLLEFLESKFKATEPHQIMCEHLKCLQ